MNFLDTLTLYYSLIISHILLILLIGTLFKLRWRNKRIAELKNLIFHHERKLRIAMDDILAEQKKVEHLYGDREDYKHANQILARNIKALEETIKVNETEYVNSVADKVAERDKAISINKWNTIEFQTEIEKLKEENKKASLQYKHALVDILKLKAKKKHKPKKKSK